MERKIISVEGENQKTMTKILRLECGHLQTIHLFEFQTGRVMNHIWCDHCADSRNLPDKLSDCFPEGENE